MAGEEKGISSRERAVSGGRTREVGGKAARRQLSSASEMSRRDLKSQRAKWREAKVNSKRRHAVVDAFLDLTPPISPDVPIA